VSQWWGRLRDVLDGRALRERVLIFLAAAALVLLAGYEGLIRPAMQAQAELEGRTQQVRQETRGYEARIQELAGTDFRAKERRLRQRKRDLGQRLEARRRALGDKVGRFIRPERLMAFFEDLLLARDPSSIRVRRVESLAKEPVALGASDGEDGPGIGLFRKGVAVGYRGTFEETLAFLDRIEALDWAVQVTRLDYAVLEFPRAEVSLTAHTFVLEPTGRTHAQ